MKKLLVTIVLGATVFSAQAGARDSAIGSAQPDITRQQARERADGLFQMFDLNRDGVITREEANEVGQKLMAQRGALHRDVAPGFGGRTLKYLKRTFAGAQSVTRQQFEDAMLAHFDEMDANHDGVVTNAEREQARTQRAEARPVPPQPQ
jgi:hypothetical protein